MSLLGFPTNTFISEKERILMTEYDMNYFENLSKELDIPNNTGSKRFVWTVWVNHVFETHLERISKTLDTLSFDEPVSDPIESGLDQSFYDWVSWGVRCLQQNSKYSGDEISEFFETIEEQLQNNFKFGVCFDKKHSGGTVVQNCVKSDRS